jgi:hypothetical protein
LYFISPNVDVIISLAISLDIYFSPSSFFTGVMDTIIASSFLGFSDVLSLGFGVGLINVLSISSCSFLLSSAYENGFYYDIMFTYEKSGYQHCQ